MRTGLSSDERYQVTWSLNAALRPDGLPRSHCLPATTVRPRGEWLSSTTNRAKLHRVGRARAVWVNDRPFLGCVALCGWHTTNARLFVRPPDLEICDHCLFANEHVAYRYFDVDDTLIYVGYTVALLGRLNDHHRGSEWWPLVYRGTYEIFPDEASARAAETAAIKTENPIANLPTGLNARESRRRLSLVLAERLARIPALTP